MCAVILRAGCKARSIAFNFWDGDRAAEISNSSSHLRPNRVVNLDTISVQTERTSRINYVVTFLAVDVMLGLVWWSTIKMLPFIFKLSSPFYDAVMFSPNNSFAIANSHAVFNALRNEVNTSLRFWCRADLEDPCNLLQLPSNLHLL